MNKLLVVEDEENTAEMLRRYFQTVGYQVFNAFKGQDALRIARDEQPHVILMDIILPDIDGFETARLMRSQKSTNQIPIIFLTDKRDRGNRVQGLRMGVDDYVTKPFDLEELRLRVHNIASRVSGVAFVDARTGLPSLPTVEKELPTLLNDADRHIAVIGIEPYESFAGRYGPVKGNDIIRRAAEMIADALHEVDPLHSFLGHLDDHTFVVRASDAALSRLESKLPARFSTVIEEFYDGMQLGEGQEVLLLELDVARLKADALDDQIAAVKSLAVPGSRRQAAPEPTGKPRHTCPACGFMTFDSPPGSGDACAICGWKDHLEQLRYPGKKEGANASSLFEFQKPHATEDQLRIKQRQGFQRDPSWRPLRQDENRMKSAGDEPDSSSSPYYWLQDKN